jgi:hypothetical protein
MRGGGRGQLKLKLYPTSQFFQNFSKILQQQKSLSALQKQNPGGILTSRIFCYRAKITLDFSFYIG